MNETYANANNLEQIERDLLLEGIARHYGYDFREYATASLNRRICAIMEKEKLSSMTSLLERILHDPACMERFLENLTIHVTSMFRDPGFYRAVRTKAVPMLRTYPFIRIWVAGCSSGEEVYSTAILLREEGLYDRCRIYATDLSDEVIKRAQEGIFPLKSMRDYTRNYQQAGGKGDFSSYYTADHENAIFENALKENLTFSQHSLTADASFNEFNMVLCRNVLIYFSKSLQDRVFELLHGSLCSFGILGLGKKESLHFSPYERFYEELEPEQRLFRRVS